MESQREKGKRALALVMTKEKNIAIFEKNAYKLSICSDMSYEELISQIVYDFLELKGVPNRPIVLNKRLKRLLIGWNHPSYDDERFYLDEQNNFIEKPFEVEEGVLECKCGSKKVFSFTKQTRSADEPMTTFAECFACGKKWTYAG